LTELLDTRVMVKQAMKRARDNKALTKILDARQLGLKYIANVTYGYTSATFSGRMPAVEIADSIVQSGRETLEKAIKFIESNEKWGARVVYGDTDSMFVYLSGKTKEQAFRIGYDIADAVTRQNPVPIKLKFEKVRMFVYWTSPTQLYPFRFTCLAF
jgi:DNA polymerase zeta